LPRVWLPFNSIILVVATIAVSRIFGFTSNYVHVAILLLIRLGMKLQPETVLNFVMWQVTCQLYMVIKTMLL
jgi:hypothetical protein